MSLSAQVRANRDAEKRLLDSILVAPTQQKRDLTVTESAAFDASIASIAQYDSRLAQLENDEKREAAAAAARVLTGNFDVGQFGPAGSGWSVGGESHTYHRGATSPSFFRDMIWAQRGDADAADRLRRNNRETGLEARALGNTGGAGGSGGEFAPPAWLIEDWIKLARPGRITADLFDKQEMPSGVSSINIPKVATGTTAAVQTTQNSALSQTDMTTTSLTSTIVTIGGKEVISQQLIDQSGIPFDQMILEDLTADYARQLGTQVLTGTGTSGQLRGFLTPSSTNVVTWTQATPTAGGFYSQLAKLQGQINATRYMPPDSVVMHPRRWAWLASYVDSTGRPLVVPTSGGFNSMAEPGASVAAGHVGSILGMDVYTDPNIPITLGTGTNQDIVLMFPRNDIKLWESTLRTEAINAPYADTVGVLLRVYNYSAMIPDRYLASLGQISGTGLVSPVFVN